jgi:hypothetical protein
MNKISGWIAAVAGSLAIGVAMMLWSLAPSSECSTPDQIQWWSGLVPFGLFVVAGAYTIVRGTIAQRLLIFLASAAMVAAYVWVFSRSLPIVIDTEIGCATTSDRV